MITENIHHIPQKHKLFHTKIHNFENKYPLNINKKIIDELDEPAEPGFNRLGRLNVSTKEN